MKYTMYTNYKKEKTNDLNVNNVSMNIHGSFKKRKEKKRTLS